MGTYKIQRGDTLGALARQYGTSVSALAKLNKISNPNRIYAGTNLNIPGYNDSPAPSAPAAPKVPTLDEWLAGDSTYQQQLANYNRSKADYESQWNAQNANTSRDYEISNRALQQQGVKDRENQLNDYAGRGVVNSGVFGTALSDYNTDFNNKVNNLALGNQDALANQANAKTNFLRQLQFEQDTAKQDAIRRRAQQLGI